MSFTEAVSNALRQYAVFRGRATQLEYWFFFLFVLVAQVPFFVLTMLLEQPAYAFGFVAAVALPLYAVGARRLHDTGRSGWWQLLPLVPVAGAILLIVWLASDGTGDNRHGPSLTRAAPR